MKKMSHEEMMEKLLKFNQVSWWRCPGVVSWCRVYTIDRPLQI